MQILPLVRAQGLMKVKAKRIRSISRSITALPRWSMINSLPLQKVSTWFLHLVSFSYWHSSTLLSHNLSQALTINSAVQMICSCCVLGIHVQYILTWAWDYWPSSWTILKIWIELAFLFFMCKSKVGYFSTTTESFSQMKDCLFARKIFLTQYSPLKPKPSTPQSVKDYVIIKR